MKEKISKWCLSGGYIIGVLVLIIIGIDYYNKIQKEKNRLLTFENILEVENVGQQIQLELNSQNKNEEVVYEVKDPTIVEVAENGTLIGVSEGITTITVTNAENTKSQTFVVVVGKSEIEKIKNEKEKIQQLIEENRTLLPSDDINNESDSEDSNIKNDPVSENDYPVDIKVKGISLSKKEVTLAFNKSTKLTATIKPTNATNKKIIWSTTNSKLVSVDNEGNIKAVANKNGKATITATTKDGKYKASATVTVKAVDTSTPSVSSIATDRITFESLSNGNAILLQSSDDFMLIDAGKGEDSCTTIVDDIKKRVGTNHIKYAIISHFHVDHVSCLESILNKVVIDNIIIKDYTNYTYASEDTEKINERYKKILQTLKNNNVNIYQIYDKNYTLTTPEGHNFGFKGKKDEIKSTTCTEDYCVKKYNDNLSITVNLKDLNKSRINLSLGNYYLRLFNLPLRNDEENLNSISVYGMIDGYKFYIANDLTNGGTNFKSTTYKPYGNTTKLLEATRKDGITPSRLADYYAWFVNKYFSKGTVDIYQAGHHGYSNGTTTYIADLLIDKKTKIVFTNSANQLYSSIEGWKTNPNTLLIASRYKDKILCSGLSSDKADYHRCLNDYSIARISYVLKQKGTTKTGIYYLANSSDKTEKPLTFGFNNPNASRITVSGGEYITYDYDSIFDKYALYRQ